MTTATMSRATINGKPIQFHSTAAWNDMYGGLEASLYINRAMEVLHRYPYDMLVFEMPDPEHFHIRVAGYHLANETLNETLIGFKTLSLPIERFWMKIDNMGDFYLATFLFPSEY